VLLVLDNASTAEQVLDLLAQQAIHRAVVTTRDTLTLPSTRRLELDVLNIRESMSLLRQALRRQLPDDQRVDDDRPDSPTARDSCHRGITRGCGAEGRFLPFWRSPGMTALADGLPRRR
jgi:hypothetical protein